LPGQRRQVKGDKSITVSRLDPFTFVEEARHALDVTFKGGNVKGVDRA